MKCTQTCTSRLYDIKHNIYYTKEPTSNHYLYPNVNSGRFFKCVIASIYWYDTKNIIL